jgi:type I restriction enzyme S subunit
LPRYLHFAMLGPAWRSTVVERVIAGSTVDRIPIIDFPKFPIELPDLETQRRVVDVLGAIVDLIENNRRRIALLEQMAQAIYREWFVHFRYPGHEDDELVDSALGPIPSSWNPGTIADVCAFLNRGIAPKYAADGEWQVVNQRCIRDGRLSLERSRRQERSVPPEKQVLRGDVLINSTGEGTLGRVAQVLADLDKTTVDTHVTIARPAQGVDPDWFGLTLLARQSEFAGLAVGSTGQTELSRQAIASASIQIAPEPLQRSFGANVASFRLLARSLEESAIALRGFRDLLLPKLVTGTIDVSLLDLDALLGERGA